MPSLSCTELTFSTTSAANTTRGIATPSCEPASATTTTLAHTRTKASSTLYPNLHRHWVATMLDDDGLCRSAAGIAVVRSVTCCIGCCYILLWCIHFYLRHLHAEVVALAFVASHFVGESLRERHIVANLCVATVCGDDDFTSIVYDTPISIKSEAQEARAALLNGIQFRRHYLLAVGIHQAIASVLANNVVGHVSVLGNCRTAITAFGFIINICHQGNRTDAFFVRQGNRTDAFFVSMLRNIFVHRFLGQTYCAPFRLSTFQDRDGERLNGGKASATIEGKFSYGCN